MFDAEKYLRERQQAEERLMQTDSLYRGSHIYCTRRDSLASLSFRRIRKKLLGGDDLKILEVGCGEGKALLKMLEIHAADDPEKALQPDNLYGTSLNHLPEHEQLEQLGINVITDVVAESLPKAWDNYFDFVLASVVMQWTEVDLAVQEINRVLVASGLFIGFDLRSIVAMTEHAATDLGMKNELTEEDVNAWEANGQAHVPFILRKD